jgi:hypothetical protein
MFCGDALSPAPHLALDWLAFQNAFSHSFQILLFSNLALPLTHFTTHRRHPSSLPSYRQHAHLQEGQSTSPPFFVPAPPWQTNVPRLTARQIQREHKAADKAGTRAPVKANGLPVKAPKPTSIVCIPAAQALHTPACR